ncbi:MAG: hypothetical protein B7Z73_03405 [Planctomycetia bacterium 21-64-5]|nr:MAG: hypothetical protein B7Z73_03405 [Planctomycetia bacterium 21-64-5]
MDAVQAANSGHPGTPMALAPVVYTLWNRVLNYDPDQPLWPTRSIVPSVLTVPLPRSEPRPERRPILAERRGNAPTRKAPSGRVPRRLVPRKRGPQALRPGPPVSRLR